MVLRVRCDAARADSRDASSVFVPWSFVVGPSVVADDGQSIGDATGCLGGFDSGSRDDRIGGGGIGWGVDFGCNDCVGCAIFPWSVSDRGQHAR